MDNRLSQNVQESRQNHKVHDENHEKLENGTDSGRKKLSWGENPEWYIPGRWAVTITMYNRDDATQPFT